MFIEDSVQFIHLLAFLKDTIISKLTIALFCFQLYLQSTLIQINIFYKYLFSIILGKFTVNLNYWRYLHAV